MKILIYLFIAIFFSASMSEADKKIKRLFDQPLDKYRIVHYKGENSISKKVNDLNEEIIIHKSNNSASALFFDIETDLNLSRLHYLNFEWKVKKFNNKNEKKKENHDFPARIYLKFKTGYLPWEKYYINYVFSNAHFKNDHWKSPYLNIFTKSHDVAINGKRDPSDYWIKHKVNLVNDIQKFWNLDISYLESIALMVDTDNTGAKTEAQYKNIYLSQY